MKTETKDALFMQQQLRAAVATKMTEAAAELLEERKNDDSTSEQALLVALMGDLIATVLLEHEKRVLTLMHELGIHNE